MGNLIRVDFKKNRKIVTEPHIFCNKSVSSIWGEFDSIEEMDSFIEKEYAEWNEEIEKPDYWDLLQLKDDKMALLT